MTEMERVPPPTRALKAMSEPDVRGSRGRRHLRQRFLELLTAGFDEVLAKPAHPADVIEAVRRHVPIGAAPRAD